MIPPLDIRLIRHIGSDGREFWTATIKGPPDGPQLFHFCGNTPIETLIAMDEILPGLRLPLSYPVKLHGNN